MTHFGKNASIATINHKGFMEEVLLGFESFVIHFGFNLGDILVIYNSDSYYILIIC